MLSFFSAFSKRKIEQNCITPVDRTSKMAAASASSSSSVKTSTPFVKIQEGRLALVGNVGIGDSDPRIRVISILGKARMGKSTLLNSIVSFLEQRDCAPFQTQDDDEHCTRGIDSYFLEKEGLVLLDCQGLALEDSSHDPALLLFAYLVSDIIIFNERMMLQNEALKLLEPVCTFMTYIDAETVKKPKLFFRISDGDIVKTPAKNLEKVLATYKDQYQSIRDSIRHLFHPEIGIVKTDTLDRTTKTALSGGNYLALLAEKVFGFEEAIKTILSNLLPPGRSGAEWFAMIPQIINSINTNSKISIDKLDLVSQTAKLELIEWMSAIPPATFAEIIVNSTQATYEANVEMRKTIKRTLLSSFTRKFKHIAAEIKTPFYQQLDERLTKLIADATEKTEKLAWERMSPLFEECARPRPLGTLSNHAEPLKNCESTIADIFYNSVSLSHYAFASDLFAKLAVAVKSVYGPVRQKIENWLNDQLAKLGEAIKKVADLERLESDTVKECCARLPKFTLEITKDNLYKSHKSIITDFINAELEKTAKQISEFVSVREIVFEMNSSKWISYTIRSCGPMRSFDHPLIGPHYSKYVNRLKTLYEDKEIAATISAAKKAVLNKYIVPFSVTACLKEEVFCGVQIPAGSNYLRMITTMETYESQIKPVIEEMFNHIEKKGYMKAGAIEEYLRYNQDGNILCATLDDKKLNWCVRDEFFKNQFGKAMMRASVRGAELPTEMSEDLVCGSLPTESVLCVPRGPHTTSPLDTLLPTAQVEERESQLIAGSIPVVMSDRLCVFLGLVNNTRMAPKFVARSILDYARMRGLINGIKIQADAALRKLLDLKEDNDLTLSNLRDYLQPHFSTCYTDIGPVKNSVVTYSY